MGHDARRASQDRAKWATVGRKPNPESQRSQSRRTTALFISLGARLERSHDEVASL